MPLMAKVTALQIGLSILLLVLFAPVFLSSGSAAFRPAWLGTRLGPLPTDIWIVLGLMVLFVLMVWIVSVLAFRRADDSDEGAAP
jgi:uncharacterized membrane protein (DUF485 family)